jgi:VanZ family protein
VSTADGLPGRTDSEHAGAVAAPGKARWPLVAALLYTCFPIYGSLLPFRWQSVPWDTALAQFGSVLQGPLQVAARTDFVANVLLATPLALLWLGALGPSPPRSRPLRSLAAGLTIWLACTALAVALEFSQIYVSGRQPALSDCVAQSLGAALGVVLWWHMPAAVWTPAPSATAAMRQVFALYLAGVVLYGLLPLDLTLSLSELSDKWHGGLVRLVPFAAWVEQPIAGLLDFALDAGIWGLAAVLARRAWGPTTVDRVVLLVAAAAALEVAQIFVLSRVVDTTDIVAAATGIVVAGFWGRAGAARVGESSRPAATVGRLWAPALGAIAGLIVTIAPYPVSLTGATLAERLPALWQPPFASYLIGTEFELVTSLLRRVFLYGGFSVLVLWALHRRPLRSGMRVLVTAATGATLAAVVEGLQLFQPGRTVDSGDVVLAALVGAAMAWAATALRPKSRPLHAPRPEVQPAVGRLGGDLTRLRRVTATLVAINLVAVLVAADAASLPYNVRELLARHGERLTAGALVLALLGYFGSAALLARSVLPGPRGVAVLRPALVLLGAPLALALLLLAGAPQESLDDIAGSPVLGSMPALETLGRLTILFLGPFWAAGSYMLRPSKISGCFSVALMASKSGLRNSFHSVTTSSASAPSSAAAWLSTKLRPACFQHALASPSPPGRRPHVAPRRASSARITRLGASRMSSVLGLKARPQMAKVRPREVFAEARHDLVDQHVLLALVGVLHGLQHAELDAVLAAGVDQRLHVLREAAAAVARAGVQEVVPMRGSLPMPLRTISMSAPTLSASSASSFMKLMRVASIALAAYLVNSALRTSISCRRSWLRMNGV